MTKSELLSKWVVTYGEGAGEHFWARSMKSAQDSVSEPIDYFLWLNNDVSLAEDFFNRVLVAINLFPDSVLIGQTSDVTSKHLTYGGLRRIGRHPFRVQLINAQEKYEEADTFCGNIVLIPRDINDRLGGIDGCYEHGYADYDFGYRAKKLGYDLRIIPGFLGTCSTNPPLLSSGNIFGGLKTLLSKKYLPIRSQIRFCKRHGGIEWPLYVLIPYLRAISNRKPFKSSQTTAAF
jgi:hypothetical protein